MRTVAYITTTDSRDYVMCICNVLTSRSARIISINRPHGFTRGPESREHEIWFEHECAIESEWCVSVLHEASKDWKGKANVSDADAGPATG